VLARVLGQGGFFAEKGLADIASQVPAMLQQYAQQRWQRNARVQATAIRNGKIFHASGLVALGRNMAMKLQGEGLLDQPWLYCGA
jgi:salicylate hydroxylase